MSKRSMSMVAAACVLAVVGGVAWFRHDPKTRRAVFAPQALSGPNEPVRFSPKPITVANAADVVQVARLGLGKGFPMKSVFSPNRRFLALLNGNYSVTVIDTRTGEVTLWFDAAFASATAVANDGKTMAVADRNAMWLVKPNNIRPLECPGFDPKARAGRDGLIALSPDGKEVAIWGVRTKACVINANTLKIVRRQNYRSQDSPVDGYFVRDHVLYRSNPPESPTVTLGTGGVVEVSGTDLEVEPSILLSPKLGISGDGSTVIAYNDLAMEVFRTASVRLKVPLPAGRGSLTSVELSNDGTRALLTFGADPGDEGASLIDLNRGRELWSTKLPVRNVHIGADQVTVRVAPALMGVTLKTGAVAWTSPIMDTGLLQANDVGIESWKGSISLSTGRTTPIFGPVVSIPEFAALAGPISATSRNSEPGVVRISTGKARRKLSVGGQVSALALRPDGQELMVGYRDGRLERFTVSTGQSAGVVTPTQGRPDPSDAVSAIAYNAGGDMAIGTQRGRYEVFAAGGTQLGSQKVSGSIVGLALSPDGTRVAVSFNDDKPETSGPDSWHLQVLGVADGIYQADVAQLTKVVSFSTDGSTVVFGQGATLQRITIGGRLLRSQDLISFPLTVVAEGNGASVYEDTGLVERIVGTGTPAVSIAHVDEWVSSSPHRFVSGVNGVVIENKNSSPPTVIRTSIGLDPVMSPNGRLLLVGAGNRVVAFDPVSGVKKFSTVMARTDESSTGFVSQVVFSPDGRRIGVSGSRGGWILDTNGRIVRQLALNQSGSAITTGQFSGDSKLFAASSGTVLQLFDTTTAKLLADIEVTDYGRTRILFAADQSYIAVSNDSGLVRVFAVPEQTP